MKQVILITAYKNVSSLIDIVNFFDDSFNFYIHFDRKINVDLSALSQYRNVFVFRDYSVNWGGVNHLKAILTLVDTALKNPENSFFHLITAEDFPVKSIQYFKNLDQNKNYLESFELPTSFWSDNGGMDRLDYYNFFDILNAKKKMQHRIIGKLLLIQKKIRLKRSYPEDFLKLKLYGGSTYWSLNRNVLEHIVQFDANKKILKRFDYTFCAEEIYIQTVLLNSPYIDSIVNDNLRFIDWQSGRNGYPAFLDETDFDSLISSNKLFARKMNDSNTLKSKLVDYLIQVASS